MGGEDRVGEGRGGEWEGEGMGGKEGKGGGRGPISSAGPGPPKHVKTALSTTWPTPMASIWTTVVVNLSVVSPQVKEAINPEKAAFTFRPERSRPQCVTAKKTGRPTKSYTER